MPDIYELYDYNVNPGPHHEGLSALSEVAADEWPVRYIAYYLPQFHTISLNDEAWGTGFTEWTNTTRALPRYAGHYQPRLPADLGFYNLAEVENLRRQAILAKRGGIYGFCFHYYWFSGQELLETPISLLAENPDIDLPFCINWANENWTRTWDGKGQQVLIEQKYHDDDPARFAEKVIPLLRDPRYIRVNGRPLLMLYRPTSVPDIQRTISEWRRIFESAGVGNPYLVMPQIPAAPDPRAYGFDAAAGFPPHMVTTGLPDERWRIDVLDKKFVGTLVAYDNMIERAVAHRPTDFPYFPGVCPSWDNTARRPLHGFSFYGSTPAKYGRWLQAATEQALAASNADERIVFINAWNEWAEGAYLEPDRHHGFAYLAETRRIFDRVLRTPSTASVGEFCSC